MDPLLIKTKMTFTEMCENMKRTMEDNVRRMKNIEEMLKSVELVDNTEEDTTVPAEDTDEEKAAIINTKFVEEEISITVNFVEKDTDDMMMVIDSGAPVSLVSSTWLKNYLESAKVSDEEVERSSSNQRYRLGKTLYISVEKVKFSVMM